MERLAFAILVELSGTPACDPVLVEAGVLEPDHVRMRYKLPLCLPPAAFQEEREDAWLFARTAAILFGRHAPKGETLQNWMLYSFEFEDLTKCFASR